MTRQTHQPPLSITLSPAHIYSDPELAKIISRSEVKKMWRKSFTTIDHDIDLGKLTARKTVSGGAVLITLQSVVKAYGPPKDTTLFECYNGSSDLLEMSDKSTVGESI